MLGWNLWEDERYISSLDVLEPSEEQECSWWGEADIRSAVHRFLHVFAFLAGHDIEIYNAVF